MPSPRPQRQLRRLLQLMDLLAHGQWTAHSLAQHFHVTRRTIYRDIEALAEVQWPVEKVEGAEGARYHRKPLTDV